MDDERWSRVKLVFDAAVAGEVSSREAIIQEGCAGDSAAASEARALLSAYERSTLFLETPAAEMLASRPAEGDEHPPLAGPWRILRSIGRGGMADVYLAERSDGQFQKRVAVKVLRGGLLGADARARFAREQQVLADLDHPLIVRILDGGVTGDDRPYFVMDFVDGVGITDHTRLHSLSRKERLELFLRVCEAVSHAHERGVIHRDLKPGNILVTADGGPKLLDFGIAKLLEPDYGGDPTSTGTRSFTPQYASPEQVRGEPVSETSDVYSLGLVLYQLLLDHPPFHLDALAPHEAARVVCEQMPDTGRLPRRLAAIVRKAVRKAPAERYASVDVLAANVRRYLSAPGREWISARLVRFAAAGVAAIVAIAGAGLFAARFLWNAPRGPSTVLHVLTTYPGLEDHPSLSPSGFSVVFGRSGGGIRGLWLLDITSNVPSQLTSEDDCCAKWSPDGNLIAFARRVDRERFDLSLIGPSGGPVRTVARIQGNEMFWDRDSKALAFADRSSAQQPYSIHWISLDGKERRRLTNPPSNSWGDVECAYSPDGRSLALVRYTSRGNGDLYVVPAMGGDARRITNGEGWINGLAWTADSKEIVFSATRAKANNKAGLWRVPVTNGAQSQPALIPLPAYRGLASKLSVANGRAVFEADIFKSILLKMPLGLPAQALPVRLAAPYAGRENPSYSPDGKRLAFFANPKVDHEIWTINTEGPQNATQITHTRGLYTRWPAWSPDGSRIAYTTSVRGRNVLQVVASGGGESRQLSIGDFEASAPRWSRDSHWIYFRCDRSGSSQICKIAADGEGGPVQITKGGGVEAFESANGDLLYFLRSHDFGKLLSVPVSGGVERELQESPTVKAGFWTVVRTEIYFLEFGPDGTGDRVPVKRFDPSTRKVEILGWIDIGSGIMVPDITVRPDGKEISWCWMERGADLMLIENFR